MNGHIASNAPTSSTDELIEALAEIEHAQWMHWSQAVAANVPTATRDKWQRSWVEYAELPDDLRKPTGSGHGKSLRCCVNNL